MNFNKPASEAWFVSQKPQPSCSFSAIEVHDNNCFVELPKFNKLVTLASLLNRNSLIAPASGVTKFTNT
jgi:hypothetical protein